MSTLPLRHRIPFWMVGVLSLAVAGCNKPLVLADQLGAEVGDSQNFVVWDHDTRALAPIIIVGLVSDNHVVARHIRAARYPSTYLDLHVVRCRCENVLRGKPGAQEVSFYYFADAYPEYRDAKPNPIYSRLFEATSGTRYLFFLRWDNGRLRSVGDVGPYPISVATGFHSSEIANEEDVGAAVSAILLTIGEGADLNRLTASVLGRYSRISDRWGSRPLSVRLLRQLCAKPEPVRFNACGVLATQYRGQEDCLQALYDDAGEPLEHRQEAFSLLRQNSPDRQRFLESLRDPARLDYMDWPGDSLHRMREEFETLLFNPDPVLHERACGALKRYFPYHAERECHLAPPSNPGSIANRLAPIW